MSNYSDFDTGVTQYDLRNEFRYDGDTGTFTWLVSKKGVTVGSRAGYVSSNGYLTIKFRQRLYMAHRLAWVYTFGKWPTDMIDHINGDKLDNRICNLREATCKQNIENAKTPITNKSGRRGVFFNKRYPLNPFVAKICHNGKCIHIGNYPTVDEAYAAYLERRDQLFTHHRNIESISMLSDMGVELATS